MNAALFNFPFKESHVNVSCFKKKSSTIILNIDKK